jgi:hypothetical protein
MEPDPGLRAELHTRPPVRRHTRRLLQPGEGLRDGEEIYKLHPEEVPVRSTELSSDKAAAELELRSKLGTLRYLLGVKEREAAKDAAAAAAKAAAATAAAAAEPPGEEEQADTRDQGAVEQQQQQQQGPPRQEAADAGPAGPGATQQQAAGPAGQGGTEKEDEDELCPVCQVSARLLLPLARLAQTA